MKDATFFANPQMVEDYVVPRFRQTGKRLRFPEALLQMKQEGMLSPDPLPAPAFFGDMSLKDFERAFNAMPFDASYLIHSSGTYVAEGIVEENLLFPSGRDVYCIRHLPYMNTDTHTHTYFEITYICSGKCQMLFGGETIEMNAGEMCIVPPDSPHAQPVSPGCFAIGLMVRRSTFDALFGELLIKDDMVSSFFRESLYGARRENYLRLYTDLGDGRLRWYLQTLVSECYRADPHANSCSISLIKLFLAQAFRAYGSTATFYRVTTSGERRADCGMLLQYIQQNYRSITLHELARVFHYNEAYLSRLLQSYTGRSFTELVRTLRMARAEEYLQGSELKIQEIAQLIGYDSADHFSRTFKSTYGVSPQAFRNQRRRKNTE